MIPEAGSKISLIERMIMEADTRPLAESGLPQYSRALSIIGTKSVWLHEPFALEFRSCFLFTSTLHN